jgi:hypothetical protein
LIFIALSADFCKQKIEKRLKDVKLFGSEVMSKVSEVSILVFLELALGHR